MRAFDLWKMFEEGGGLLVLCGVIGQVWASSSETEGEQFGEISSVVLAVGLVFSLASLVGADGHVNAAIATILDGGIVLR